MLPRAPPRKDPGIGGTRRLGWRSQPGVRIRSKSLSVGSITSPATAGHNMLNPGHIVVFALITQVIAPSQAQEGLVMPYGVACGNLALAEAGIPRLDHALNMNVTGAAASSATLFFLGTSAASIDLSPIGAPTCTQLLATPRLDAIVMADGLGRSSRTVSIPISSALVGARVRGQVLDVDPAANALGGTTSNGLEVTIGDFGPPLTITSAPGRGTPGQLVGFQVSVAI